MKDDAKRCEKRNALSAMPYCICAVRGVVCTQNGSRKVLPVTKPHNVDEGKDTVRYQRGRKEFPAAHRLRETPGGQRGAARHVSPPVCVGPTGSRGVCECP